MKYHILTENYIQLCVDALEGDAEEIKLYKKLLERAKIYKKDDIFSLTPIFIYFPDSGEILITSLEHYRKQYH
jgi:hypothetical protein